MGSWKQMKFEQLAALRFPIWGQETVEFIGSRTIWIQIAAQVMTDHLWIADRQSKRCTNVYAGPAYMMLTILSQV